MYQRGGVGIPVVMAVVGGVVVLFVGYSFVSVLTDKGIENDPVPITVSSTVEADPAKTQSIVSFDENFARSGDDFFIRIAAGLDANGKQTYSYVKVDIADAKTFHKVPVNGGPINTPIPGARKGGTMPAFYMDSQQVYFFTGTSVIVLQGADPGTFQVLSPTYAKDENNVYYVTITCEQNGNCTGSVSVIPGANPGTFETHHETTVPDPDGSGTVQTDAHDDQNIYYYGIWVGPLPDPDDHSVHPDVDNPVLISP